ncbi:hypothetical protein UlMin_007458 [Ulmus minor]
MEGEKMVHIIDMKSSEPAQWINILQTLSACPKGPLYLRIIGIHEQKEFIAIVSKLENLDIGNLRVKTREALAVSSKEPIVLCKMSLDFALSQLSISCSPKMGSFLYALWGLSPKLMVVVEIELNIRGYTLLDRISNSLFFMQLCSIAWRAKRKERHEKLEKWILRLKLAGFRRVPLNYRGRMQAIRLLQQSYGFGGYNIKEENGCLVICWQDRSLFSVSAWRFRR